MSGRLDFLLGWDSEPETGAGSSYRWATVTGTSPLRIRFDGESAPADVTPAALCQVWEGARVWVQIYGRQLVIMGAAQQQLPAEAHVRESSSNNIDLPVTTGSVVDLRPLGLWTTPLELDLPAPAMVDVSYSGWFRVSKGNSLRARFGLEGATPDPPTGHGQTARSTAYGTADSYEMQGFYLERRLKFNAGKTRVFPMGSQTSNGAGRIHYNTITARPVSWA